VPTVHNAGNRRAGQNAQVASVIIAHALAANAVNMIHGIHGGAFQNVPVQPANQQASSGPDWIAKPPRRGSWAYIIDILTPGETLADIRYSRDLGSQPPIKDLSRLRRLEFKSCGYIFLPLDFDQRILDLSESLPHNSTAFLKRINDIEPFMVKSEDPTLGIIINHMSDEEERILENAWNMRLGWGMEHTILTLDCCADGVTNAGKGRFSGIINTSSLTSHESSL